jgi:hypothetical protein
MAPNDENIRPASEDPLGDPADQADLQDAVSQHLGNTDPSYTQQQAAGQVEGMSATQTDDLASTLLNLVRQQGVDIDGLASRSGIDLSQAGQYLPQLVGLLHQNHPDELSQAAVQEPGIAGLIAHPSVGGILGALASRFLGGR